MTKIREIIKINSGYTSFVDLYNDYYNIENNRHRMKFYKPITAHRVAFDGIANALNPLDRRCYFLSGSYGTGKSHLMLMLANFFANTSDVEELEAFFENYRIAQSEIKLKPGEILKERSAASLRDARKSDRYLVAICRFDLNLDFEGAVLRALEDTLKIEGSKILLDTHYSEAIRRIKDWQNRRNETRFFTDLEAVIKRSYSEWTIDRLLDELQQFKEEALKVFKNCFREVTDSEFSYSKDNLRDIISDFLSNSDFKSSYRGIVLLYDEFGSAIDDNLVNYKTFLEFAQFCANSTLERGGPVIFIGTGHKAFIKHGQVGNLNAETLAARVTEIGLQTQGMEDIIAAIVQPLKESSDWIQYVQSQNAKFTWFSNECNRLHLFNWLPAPKIKNNIILNIYPMHPLATFALLKLAGEAGANNRSVFKFFSPEFETGEKGWINVQPNSYPWFIENHNIVEQNKLTLYTPDCIVDYFQDSLKATNPDLLDSIKAVVANYEATLRELNAYLARKSQQLLFEEADELMMRIIKVMLINEIVSNQDAPIANTIQNIEFALDAVSEQEKEQVENRLGKLSEAKVIFNNNGIYELVRSDRKDIQFMVDQYKGDPNNRPSNLLTNFLELTPLRPNELYLEAKEYNDSYNEDKRLKVHFVTPASLSEKHTIDGQSMPFFTWLEHERKQFSGVAGYEGTALYIFCENDNDLDMAKRAIAFNDQQRVLIAVPRNAISVLDAILTLQALKSDYFLSQSQNFSALEKADEKSIRDNATKALEEAKKAYFSNAKMYWFGTRAKEILVSEDKPRDAANQLMNTLFATKRNTFPHNEFNKSHINISGQIRAVFKEACDALCDISQPIRVNWTWPDNRGGTKYLRKCFVDYQALSILSQEGDNRYLGPEKDLNKFRAKFPAYAKLLEDLKAIEGKGQVNFVQFLKPYFEEYGQGDIAVTLMLWLSRRYYGDGLRFKRELNTLTDIQFSTSDDMLDLVQGKSPAAVILVEPVSKEDQAYFAQITQLYTNQPARADKLYTISDAFQAISNWWNALPAIAHCFGFYEDVDKPMSEALSQSRTIDPFHFIKYDLMELLGQTPGEILTSAKLVPINVRLKTFKSAAESIQDDVEDRILAEFADIYKAKSSVDDDVKDAMKDWYNNLSTSQKDPLGTYHNSDSKPLVKYTSYATIHELIFETLPAAYQLGTVSSWNSDYIANYTQRVRAGKEHIETKAPQMSQLKVDFDNVVAQKGNQVTYKRKSLVHVDTEDNQGVIYYTEDGSDPINSKGRHKAMPGESFEITGNHKIKFVVSDEKGNYSAILTYDVIDELQKHVIKRPGQQSALDDEQIMFVFPKTIDGAQISVLSLFKELSESGFYSEAELKNLIKLATESLKKSK